jgi:hypothetical protein
MMRRRAGFHANQARLNRLKISQNLAAPQAAADQYLAISVDAVDLKPVLGEIKANCANLHMGGSFHVVFTDDHFGTSMPGAGALHLIKFFGFFQKRTTSFLIQSRLASGQ